MPNTDVPVLDLAAEGPGLERMLGSASTGRFGVPVAGGFDCDGDGFVDYAMSGMAASPLRRSQAGQVWLAFGDGRIGGTIDTRTPSTDVLVIAGATTTEHAGIEVWMDDVTGDGLGDVIVGRSSFSIGDRIGAGALSVVVGGPVLRAHAARGVPLDLGTPPAGVAVLTFVGAVALDRLGFWMRTGDVTGDGVADLLMSADQADRSGENNAGSAYLVRGGSHTATTTMVDLAEFGQTPLAEHILRFAPPPSSADHHFGATLALADLDGDDRAEVLIASSLSRVGGLLQSADAPEGAGVRNGGNPGGSLFIFWGDQLPEVLWPPGMTVTFDPDRVDATRIDGGSIAGLLTSDRFGEELIGGADYDGNGRADLFVGDIRGDAPGRRDTGLGHVFFDASDLRGRTFALDAVPDDIRVTHVIGLAPGTISSDTSLQGDIDGDGLVDLVTASPLGDPRGRRDAGVIHVLWGQQGPWPDVVDLAERPAVEAFKTTDIYGAQGASTAEDFGDTLMYSAMAADVDADGRTDLIVNEMLGNGSAPAMFDVGNLLVISGAVVPKP